VKETKEGPHLEETGLRGEVVDARSTSGWAVTGLDFFWPALAVVLAVAVVFVASVARSSMDSVGAVASTAVPVGGSPRPTSSGAAVATTLTIVQISSHSTQGAARAAAERVTRQGYPVRILVSDQYQPLNPGYFVVCTGPYGNDAAGRAEAKRVQARFPGSLVRVVRSR
jgi:SPOR domain